MTAPLEIRCNSDGTLDEIVGSGSFHLEQMSDGHWWLEFEDEQGSGVHVHLQSKGKISAHVERKETT